jgi:thymidylate synthase (FAD)
MSMSCALMKTIVSSKVPLLDQGYLQLVDAWGSDEDIVRAARMSTGKGFLGWDDRYTAQCTNPQCPSPASYEWRDEPPPSTCPHCTTPMAQSFQRGDVHLLKRLWTKRHMSPFEMAGLTVEAKLPIFVAREWIRHRSLGFNEMSARYTPLPDEYYVPSVERLMAGKQSATNKQSSQDGFTEAAARDIRAELLYAYDKSCQSYHRLLAAGVARELARAVLPVGWYTTWRCTGNLRNWLHFLGLRLDPASQWEIRVYAEAISQAIQQQFPRVHALFTEYPHQ